MGCRLIGFRGGAKEVVLPPLLLEPCQHKQKVTMAFPSSHSVASGASSLPPVRHPTGNPRCSLQAERDHQLEKLEFALAVALTRGDSEKSLALRQAIEALGGNDEEPGT
jgi:hypothetical protein